MKVQRFSIPGRLDEIERVSSIVGDCAMRAGFDELTSYACELAVGEACENIIKHGYGQENPGAIRVKIEASPGEIMVELADDAPPFDAAKKPEPESWAPDDPPVGGLGLKIIHTVMDEIQYRRLAHGNRLQLRKCIPSSQDPT
jgi:anti-sigma regulatory factor (Ser/Thr protein kinase)